MVFARHGALTIARRTDWDRYVQENLSCAIMLPDTRSQGRATRAVQDVGSVLGPKREPRPMARARRNGDGGIRTHGGRSLHTPARSRFALAR
jgi:hypothetical protein